MSKGILLLNLGSPDSPNPKDVKRYLAEFLMDENVIDIPKWKRTLLVKGIILNTRPKQSAKAYKKVWTDEGSPLIVISENFQKMVKDKVGEDITVSLGMRYGNPSIKSALLELKDAGVDDIYAIPLYPQYAMSSTGTVIEKLEADLKEMNWNPKLKIQEPFFDQDNYIDALSKNIEKQVDLEDPDLFLFSYHGIPERHIIKTDPTQSHCKIDGSCCNTPSEAHRRCYRHQCFETTKKVAEKLNLPEEKVKVSFQSRLGRTPWLKPYTDHMLEELPEKGVKNLAIITPAFVADCLETIEEIGMEGEEEFLEAGGEKYTRIECLNTDENWAQCVVDWSKE